MAKVDAPQKGVLDDVQDWRLSQMLEAGIGQEEAIELAQSSADLHKVVEAKTAGCRDDQLLEIFL